MPFPFATVIPIAGAVTREIVQGINNRKARLYNSPANQIKRLREAGLPTAAGSSIGGGVQTPTNVSGNFGTESLNDNLGKSITRNIDKKQLEIKKHEADVAAFLAAEAADLNKNKLGTAGTYTNTNQGMGYNQTMQAQAAGIQSQNAAIQAQNITNEFLPKEKALGLAKSAQDIQSGAVDISNKLQQHKILISEAAIKNILAQYQPSMGQLEKERLINSNAGQLTANERAAVQYEIENTGKEAAMSRNQWQADITSEQFKQMMLNNDNLRYQLGSYEQWYSMKQKVDEAVKNKTFWSPADIKAFIYTLLYNPTPSGGNMAPIGAGLNFIPK